METSRFDFKLPEKLIALDPVFPKDSAKLLEVRNEYVLHSFDNLSHILNDGAVSYTHLTLPTIYSV